MSDFEFASFTESSLPIQAPNPAVAIEFAPSVSDLPEDRQERIEAVLATCVFAIDAGLRTHDPDNLKASQDAKNVANVMAGLGDNIFTEARVWQISHHEKDPEPLLRAGRNLGSALIDASNADSNLNVFGDAIVSAGNINSEASYSSHWRGRFLRVIDVAKCTLALGLYEDNQQLIDPAMLARELSDPELASAMGRETIDDLGIHLSPNQPEAVNSLSYSVGYTGMPTIAPNAVCLRGITDYLADSDSGWQSNPYLIGPPLKHQTSAYMDVSHRDSPLELRFEIDASPDAHATQARFVQGENPGELFVVDDSGNPTILQSLALKTSSRIYLAQNKGRAKTLEPTWDIVAEPEMARYMAELNTVLTAIRGYLIS